MVVGSGQQGSGRGTLLSARQLMGDGFNIGNGLYLHNQSS